MSKMKHKMPGHGLPDVEFEGRLTLAQKAMTAAKLDGLVVTSPHNVRYFTGFESQFWESPTRPWYVIVPRVGKITLTFPEIGVPAIQGKSFVGEILSWPAPRPADDGITTMAAALGKLKSKFGRVGWEFGREMLVRAPRTDVDAMAKQARGIEFVDGSPVIWGLRQVKSAAEIDRIRQACQIGSRAFATLGKRLRIGDTAREATRKMAMAMLEHGADHVPFLALIAGKGGYSQIIAGPSDKPIKPGDVLIVDAGCTYDGYFCDFDRNFAFSKLTDAARRAHEAVWEATKAGMAAARPGATMADLLRAMTRELERVGSLGNNVGRMGHGLGMQLTEPPSIMAGDPGRLVPGMVMTIEPGMEYAPGRMIVHEENIAITDDGFELLTTRAPREMWSVTE